MTEVKENEDEEVVANPDASMGDTSDEDVSKES